jgi:hypothetical protein
LCIQFHPFQGEISSPARVNRWIPTIHTGIHWNPLGCDVVQRVEKAASAQNRIVMQWKTV